MLQFRVLKEFEEALDFRGIEDGVEVHRRDVGGVSASSRDLGFGRFRLAEEWRIEDVGDGLFGVDAELCVQGLDVVDRLDG